MQLQALSHTSSWFVGVAIDATHVQLNNNVFQQRVQQALKRRAGQEERDINSDIFYPYCQVLFNSETEVKEGCEDQQLQNLIVSL